MTKSFSTLDDQALQAVAGGLVTLVEFTQPDCEPCKSVSAAVDAVAAQFGDQIAVVRVDASQNPGLADQFGVRATPTVSLVNNSQYVGSATGRITPAKLSDWVHRASALG
ncbi:thioredoxin [Synechococcus sp. CB0101]|uniref:thioredoxin family protein n=1 Tax=Synechococcus sp. CB0101 TaxID=232348 RepID=UPI0008FEFFFA|nr:thioredoxin [Synechococcus sp. CB0101]